ncbi:MAG: LicD family protein [Clostridiales bacterium]|nr:LicD family protein [Roseburia sp.]MDD7637182.1 LicD family protein [Clostridiales bacterium]
MLEFPEGFFEDEERDGFLVEEMMKRAWAAQMKVLEEIGRICKKYDITYFADCGTLLGAVRHHGFVPWDDDIDIAMKPCDYKRFLKVAEAELPEGWKLLSLYTHDQYTEIFARVVNSNKINGSPEWLKEWYGCPFAVGVDIFPLNYMPVEEEDVQLQKNLYVIVKSAREVCEKHTEETEKLLDSVEELCGATLERSGNLKKQLAMLMEGIRTMYDEEAKGEITKLDSFSRISSCRMPQEAFDEAVSMVFEGMDISVPVGWDTVLKAEYGEDYMTPVRGGQKHDYPFYKKQLKNVSKKRGNS